MRIIVSSNSVKTVLGMDGPQQGMLGAKEGFQMSLIPYSMEAITKVLFWLSLNSCELKTFFLA